IAEPHGAQASRAHPATLRLEQPLVPERSLQIGLHLHGPELLDGKVQIGQRFRPVALEGGWSDRLVQQQFGELEASKGDLWSVTDRAGPLDQIGRASCRERGDMSVR